MLGMCICYHCALSPARNSANFITRIQRTNIVHFLKE
uniref:Uncharacterized protein n=1 Tax=Arundo donax TaxID=35708 RepID=A0A0A9SHS4_ARUDO